MNIVKLTNLQTKIVWKTLVLACCNGNVRFMCVFWDFGACVEGFKHCRSITQINGTFFIWKIHRKTFDYNINQCLGLINA